MVHSVELLFDSDTETAIGQLWADLMAAGIRSLAAHSSPSNRPHVTVSVAESMDDGVDDALRGVLDRLPLRCVLGAPTLFGGGRTVTLVRSVVPSNALLGLHSEVHHLCRPHMSGGPLPHTEPGQWTPHVTLARRVPPDQLSTAVMQTPLFGEISATAVALRHWDGNNRVVHPIG